MNQRIRLLFTKALVAILLFVVGIFAVLSLFLTYTFPASYIETPRQSIVYVLLTAICCVAILALLIKTLLLTKLNTVFDALSERLFALVCATICFGIALAWCVIAGCHPVADQEAVLWLAAELHDGNYESFAGDSYLQRYPFQSGLVLLECLWGSLFGFNNWITYRLFNCTMVFGTVIALWGVTRLAFDDEKASKAVGFLLVCFVPFAAFSDFIYGNVPSLFFCSLAFFCQMKCLSRQNSPYLDKLHFALYLGSLFIGLVFRLNSLIFVIASAIVWIFARTNLHFRTKLVALVAILAIYYVAGHLPVAIIEAITGIQLGSGIPKAAWVAMGMQESLRAPGWYTGFNETVWANAVGDQTLASELSLDSIKTSILFFLDNPGYALSFYAQKVTTQWFDPTFQSLWVSFTGYGYSPQVGLPGIADDLLSTSFLQASLCGGILRMLFILWCDVIQSLIYCFAFYGLWKSRKTINPQQLLFGVAFLGGLLFHIVWEAKSCYTIPYFLMLLPYAALGLVTVVNRKAPTLTLVSQCASDL